MQGRLSQKGQQGTAGGPPLSPSSSSKAGAGAGNSSSMSTSMYSSSAAVVPTISYRRFEIGDLALFRLTANKKHYVAFHQRCPHRYLSEVRAMFIHDY
jgi:hypothetical protein